MKPGQKVALVLGIAAAAITGILIYMKFKDKLPEESKEPPIDEGDNKVLESNVNYRPPPVKNDFPLMLNVRNSNVIELQKTLISKFGQGITGSPSNLLGNNTLKALNNVGYGVPLSKDDYDKILSGVRKSTITQPVAPAIKNGNTVYAIVNNIGGYEKPMVDSDGNKKIFKKYDKVGIYMGKSSVNGWSKVFVGELNTNIFILTAALTNKKP